VAIDKNFYNEASAAKMDWDPSWFGETEFDEELVKAVKKFQRAHRLTADGLVGPTTYRRIWTDREANISDACESVFRTTKVSSNNHIVHNGNLYPIDWDAVVLWDEPDGLEAAKGQYYSYAGKEDRKPTLFVNHWDVCLTSQSCANVLAKRGISIHFCIDNDGTVYQLLDTQHGAWHASGRSWNHASVGVEISNAYYPKYQKNYVKMGYGERPLVVGATCHGHMMDPFLDFYPVQIEALKALWLAVHRAVGIPLVCPVNSDGKLVTGVSSECTSNKFEGFVNHYNLTRGKIDCAGLDLVGLLEDVREAKRQDD
jgi:hypothetical protein